MRDDEQFNINFVKKVELHKCLYDYTRVDYKNIHIQEKAWKTIADEFQESGECYVMQRKTKSCCTSFNQPFLNVLLFCLHF